VEWKIPEKAIKKTVYKLEEVKDELLNDIRTDEVTDYMTAAINSQGYMSRPEYKVACLDQSLKGEGLE
jgi:hypothetical protein